MHAGRTQSDRRRNYSSDQLCVLDIDRKCPVIYAYNCDNKSRSVDELAHKQAAHTAISHSEWPQYRITITLCAMSDKRVSLLFL